MAAPPKIQLLVFEGCPLADAAKRSLDAAISRLDIDAYEVIDILGPDVPEDLRRWGSPTILINGRDVTDAAPGDNVGCRVYSGPDRVPDAASIIAGIKKSIEPQRSKS